MRDWQGKRYWLVGASEGLGLALARKISATGAEVILSARSEDGLRKAVASMPGRARHVAMDAADMDSVSAAASEVGEVDGVVYLAGVYWPMKAGEWDAVKSAAMIDVNLGGAARVLGSVVPGMVARGAGHVVLTGSLVGFRGLPGSIGYSASKAGIMSLAECMRCDLQASGVTVQLANPGFIRTRLTEKNDFAMPAMMEPDEAAQRMFEMMQTDRFKANFPTAFSWIFRLGQFLPDWAYYRLFGA